MFSIMLRDNFTKKLPTKYHLFLTENYNWYLLQTTCFFSYRGYHCDWMTERVLSISGLQISLSLEFSLLAALANSQSQESMSHT